jgi:hypothetical protein
MEPPTPSPSAQPCQPNHTFCHDHVPCQCPSHLSPYGPDTKSAAASPKNKPPCTYHSAPPTCSPRGHVLQTHRAATHCTKPRPAQHHGAPLHAAPRLLASSRYHALEAIPCTHLHYVPWYLFPTTQPLLALLSCCLWSHANDPPTLTPRAQPNPTCHTSVLATPVTLTV